MNLPVLLRSRMPPQMHSPIRTLLRDLTPPNWPVLLQSQMPPPNWPVLWMHHRRHHMQRESC